MYWMEALLLYLFHFQTVLLRFISAKAALSPHFHRAGFLLLCRFKFKGDLLIEIFSPAALFKVAPKPPYSLAPSLSLLSSSIYQHQQSSDIYFCSSASDPSL